MTTTQTSTGGANAPQGPRSGSRAFLVALVVAAVIVALLVVAAVFYLSTRGDGEADTTPTPTASTSTTPSATASTPATPEQEAATAAQATYQQYNLLRDQAFKDGAKDLKTLELVENGEAFASDNEAARQFQALNAHQVGDTKIVRSEVKSVSLKSDPSTFTVPEVVLTSCQDASNAYAADQDGKNLRPPTAPTSYEWTFYIRHYPDQGGYNGWFIARSTGSGVKTC